MIEDGNLLNILLVGDAADKTNLVRDALQRSKNQCRLHAIGPGPNTLSYLRGEGPYAGAPTPDLVFFDTSNSDKRRLKILDKVHAETLRRDIPLVLLTNPDSEQLIDEKYDGHGGCVMFTPIELDAFLQTLYARQPARFLNAISVIRTLGFVLVRLPTQMTLSDSQNQQSVSAMH